MEDIKVNKSDILFEGVMFLSATLASGICSYLYKMSATDIIKNVCFIGIMGLLLFYAMKYSKDKKKYLYNNEEHYGRFCFLFLIFLLASCIFPIFPAGGWPFLGIFIVLSLFSNEMVGIFSGMLLLILSMLLCPGSDYLTFFVYLIPGVLGVMLFSGFNPGFKLFFPTLISALTSLVTLCVNEILVVNRAFSAGMLILPVINIFISVAVILITMKIFSVSLFYKTHDRFMDIIDPEFDLLVRLKNHSKEDYDHTIYTAVLCAKLASKLKLSEEMTKALGYYHRIGSLLEEPTWEDVDRLLTENEIPQGVIDLLKEYLDPDTPIKSKEVVVLLFSDTVISSIRYLFLKDKNIVIDYAKLIEAVFEKKLSSSAVTDSRISFEDINIMKKTLIDEKLFYDFLR